jgi:hypothetical protein
LVRDLQIGLLSQEVAVMLRRILLLFGVAAMVVALPVGASAGPILYSNLSVDGAMAVASRPNGLEIEAADDFIVSSLVSITDARFIGLIPTGATVVGINLEIYRVFPNDSSVLTPNVPTRANSPSDVAFAELGPSVFTTTLIAPDFTANNSVLNGINPKPGQTTGGEGAVRGQEVLFDVTLPGFGFVLPADHYFFVPQVQLSTGNFYWLSASRPIVPPGTPFNPDLQGWVRNGNLDPDWLRVGTDIVGGTPAPQFNFAFELSGAVTPEPASLVLMASGLAALAALSRRRRQ